MKKIMLVFLLAVSLVVIARAAEKPLGIEEFTSLSELANTIASYFPKVQGEVKAVQGNLLTIALGTKNGLKSGVVLSIWRADKEILHPVTKAVIGHTELEVGDAEVIEVGDASSTARVLKKQKDPKQGDTARITPKKISFALIPLRADRQDVVQELADRLNELGRFSVLSNSKTAAFLKDRKQRDSSLIKEMGSTLGVNVVAVIEIYPSEKGKFLVTTRMFYTEDAKALDTVTVMLDLSSRKDVFSDARPFFSPIPTRTDRSIVTIEKSVSAPLPFNAQLFAGADLDGTGVFKYVFSDGSRLHILRQEQSGWHEEWAEPGSAASDDVQHINLDVADINGNGKPEIFVTSFQDDEIVSSVFEFQEGTYRRIAQLRVFLRVLTSPSNDSILIGQGFNPDSFFAGKPKHYVWSKGTYVPEADFSLPKRIGLYGFVTAQMGESQPLLVALNNSEQLLVYSKNNAIWKSEEKYPALRITVSKLFSSGIDSVFLKDAQDWAEKTGEPSVASKEKIKINRRVYALDMTGAGRDEIIVPKNSGSLYLLTGYTESEIVSLSWNNNRLDLQWSIQDIPGAVADYHVSRLQGTGAQIVALVNSSGGWFKKDTLQVITYTVK